jgi:hypothetical protein
LLPQLELENLEQFFLNEICHYSVMSGMVGGNELESEPTQSGINTGYDFQLGVLYFL